MDSINRFAKDNNLWVVDDAAQSFGSTYKNRKVGSLCDVTSTSFFPAKPLGAYGDGGALFTNNEKIAEIAKSCRVHGQGKDKYSNVRIGMTARLDTIQAAILLSKLAIFDNELNLRQVVADQYTKNLNEIVKTPFVPSFINSSWAQYTIKLPKHINRDEFQNYLKSKNIPTAIYYPIPVHKQKPYKKFFITDEELKITNELSQSLISLPMHPYLNKKTIDFISNEVISFIKN